MKEREIIKALITGATSGIGRAIAEKLAEDGVTVIALGSHDADLRITTKPVIEAIYQHVPNLVINCAGVGSYGDVLNLSVQEQKEIVQINALAAMEISIEAARFFKERGIKGTILNVSSLTGELVTPGMVAYGASKAFLTKFSQGLDFELKPHGIRVLVSCPGMVNTRFINRSAKKEVKIYPDNLKSRNFGCVKARELSRQPKSDFSSCLGIKRKGPVMSVECAAKLILNQIERKKGFRIIDWRYRLLYTLFLFIPNNLLKHIFYKNIQSRL